MASSVQPLIQMALNTCQEHTDEELDMYCKTCKKAVCSECVKAKHIHHDWVPMSKYTRELRGKAQIRVLEVNSIADSLYKGHTEMSEFWKDKNDKECSKTSSELESMRSRLHDLIDGIINDRKKEVQNLRDAQNDKISTKDIQREWEKLKKMTLQLSEEASTLSNADIIELFDDIEKTLSSITSMSHTFSEECFQHVMFEKGKLEKSDLEKMVGDITKLSSTHLGATLSPLKELHFRNDRQDRSRSDGTEKESKEKEDNTIYCIRPISDCSAWISCGGQCRVVNIELDTADILKELSIKTFDVSEKRTLYNYGEQSILKCSEAIEACELKRLFETTPLMPVYLTITRSGDLLISLVDEWLPTRRPSSRRLLRRMTETGLTLREYEYDNDGTTPLFTCPWKSVEHYHGQICVIVINSFMNESDEFRGDVYGLDPAGRFKYKYNNNDEKFRPLDICPDMMGNTLVLGGSDVSLHCVNSEGLLLKRLDLLKFIKYSPFSIAFHKNTLWIGSNKSGQVNVYGYDY